jgi:sodium-dependent dicarboxylate transporter 2/3/5
VGADLEGSSSTAQLVGLVVGSAGFAAVFAAPALAPLPDGVRGAAALVSAAAAIALAVLALRARGVSSARRRAALGALLFCLAAALALAPALAAVPTDARNTLAVTVLMASWWMSVAIPIPATSLVPLVLLPALGIMPSAAVASNYANNIIYLFLGGFILALGLERWNLHRRIALKLLDRIGADPARMVLGFMIATAFLSMWISNTATAMMMLPIGIAVVASLRQASDGRSWGGIGPALLLGIAYGASIGGLATPIGTPPNMAFLRVFEILYPEGRTFSFGQWLVAFLPLVVVFIPLAWLVLTRVCHRLTRRDISAAQRVIDRELARLGPIAPAERRMAFVFGTTALLWITRTDLTLGSVTLPGWAGLVERLVGEPFSTGDIHDATVAMLMALLTFLLPGDPDANGRPRRLMDWETARRLPWGVLLLFGGGFALVAAFRESGLSQVLGEAFAAHVEGLHPVLLVLAVCLLLTFLTEFTSNTATTEVMLPVLAGAAGAMTINPLLVMIPATLSASCAFMLPIATPPNAIVFGSSEIEMRHMVRAGLILNLLGAALITGYFLLAAAPLLGIDLATPPAWAR